MSKDLDRRLAAAEGKAGIHRKPAPLATRQMKALDAWFKAVTGKTIAEMSCDELKRLEFAFRARADAREPMGDDVCELVLGCMDEHQTVIDLDLRRRQLDQPPWR